MLECSNTGFIWANVIFGVVFCVGIFALCIRHFCVSVDHVLCVKAYSHF